MRKLVSVFLLATGISASARQITSDEAFTLASDFMNNTELRSVAQGSKTLRAMRAPGVEANSAVSPYYVFNRGENDGFVIISGNDRAPKILGYSDKGSFDADNLPPQLKAMMEQWSVQMGTLSESMPQHASWSNSMRTRADEGILLETANWGQGAPFNDLCPTIDGQKAPAGCVATAMAIAMKYHNWPDSTRGGVEVDYYQPTETYDFDSYEINWDALSKEDDPAFAEQAAKLTYSAGVAAQMQYGPEESGAESWILSHLFQYFYAYDKDCQVIPREKFDDTQWNTILKEQLEEVGPVVYFGNGIKGGHCFVVDGYDQEGLYHVNWGWDGGSNGYFTLDFAVSEDMSFGEGHGMVINMKPDETKKIYSKVWVPNCETYIGGNVNGWNFINPDIEEGKPNKFITPTLCISNFQGYVGLAVVDENDEILKLIDDSFLRQDGARYFCSMPGSSFFGYNNLELPALKEGERYQLISQEVPNIFEGEEANQMYDPANPPSKNIEDWSIVLGGINHPSYFHMTGNTSVLSEIRYHIDESIPGYFGFTNVYGQELTIHGLKSSAEAEIMTVPRKGVKVEVTAKLNDGTPTEALYVGEAEEYKENLLNLNVSLYSDQFDVYVKYESDGNTRRDDEYADNEMVEKDGLVYKIENQELVLIGYDKVEEIVTIPESIEVGGIEMPVVSLEAEALLNAPIKQLNILPATLKVGMLSLSNMKNLETISTRTSYMEGALMPLVAVNSPLKTVYLDVVPSASPEILRYLTGAIYQNERLAASGTETEIILTALPEEGSENAYFSSLFSFSNIAPDGIMGSAMKSFVVPGLGDYYYFKSQIESLPFDIKQMWNFEIDTTNGLIAINDVLDNVVIERVLINDEEVKGNSKGIFEVPGVKGELPDVKVDYTINDFKSQSIHYTYDYLSLLEASELKKDIVGDTNDDQIINIADAINAANYIVGLPTTDFNFESADINEDGEITISDVTSVISLIPAQEYETATANNRALVKAIAAGHLISSITDAKGLELSLASDENLTALQFDLCVSSGASMPEIQLSDAYSRSHMMQTFSVDANTVRIVVYSTTGKLLNNGGINTIVTLNGIVSADDLTINNIFASNVCGASRSLDYEDLGVSNVVTGSSIALPEMKVEGSHLVVNNASGSMVSVYSIAGSCISKQSVESDMLAISLPSGIYIVTVGSRAHRVIIK